MRQDLYSFILYHQKIKWKTHLIIWILIPPTGKNPRIPCVLAIFEIAPNVEEYSPVCNFCFTTSYGTLEKDATVFPIAAAAAILNVLSVASEGNFSYL